ncbi:HAD family hydrolase [Kitasatospora kifunensis]|uniref:HAD superfamily hydrolase (TIGR01509 family) n=1 Tax=Kitasatospora kifunensis TaxID=58351 RepID=A0A7W7RA17_KITKI|nr:HAD family phosphatase [Kitasatospora kifunensis]MBB4928025.1 HAD superfamily hydrolase (TIGR01509 family) [Kitasatospora kifunensis]
MLAELHPGRARALLFDWDGTLVDSQHANYRAMAEALAPHGMTLRQEWFDARTGLSSADMIRTLAQETGLRSAPPIGELVAARDGHFLANAARIRLHPQVAEVMHTYHGVLPMAVASGGARQVIEATMRHLSLQDLFTAVVTRDEVERGKPAPDIFLQASEALAVPPAHCLVYEDSDEGIEAAHAAGMRVIDVRPFTRPTR